MINIFGKLPFSRKSDHKEKSVVYLRMSRISFAAKLHTRGSNEVVSCPMKRKENLHRMIINKMRCNF